MQTQHQDLRMWYPWRKPGAGGLGEGGGRGGPAPAQTTPRLVVWDVMANPCFHPKDRPMAEGGCFVRARGVAAHILPFAWAPMSERPELLGLSLSWTKAFPRPDHSKSFSQSFEGLPVTAKECGEKPRVVDSGTAWWLGDWVHTRQCQCGMRRAVCGELGRDSLALCG